MRAFAMVLMLFLGCKPQRQEPRCVPGHLEPCRCSGTGMGIMQCLADGTYDTCACYDAGPPEDRPTPMDTLPVGDIPSEATGDTTAPGPDTLDAVAADGADSLDDGGSTEGQESSTDGAPEDGGPDAAGDVGDTVEEPMDATPTDP